MNERSIPEILGWEPAPDDWGYVDRYFQHPTAGYAVNEHGGWTVDDLLAWIRARLTNRYPNRDADFEMWWDPEDPDVVKVYFGTFTIYCRPTFLKALEAAVRAIDAEAT